MLTNYKLSHRVFSVFSMFIATSALCFSSSASAADWPKEQPINIFVPFDFGLSGVGGSAHLSGEQFKLVTFLEVITEAGNRVY